MLNTFYEKETFVVVQPKTNSRVLHQKHWKRFC